LLGAFFLHAGWKVMFTRTRKQARAVLLTSVVYLPVLYGLMLLDRPR